MKREKDKYKEEVESKKPVKKNTSSGYSYKYALYVSFALLLSSMIKILFKGHPSLKELGQEIAMPVYGFMTTYNIKSSILVILGLLVLSFWTYFVFWYLKDRLNINMTILICLTPFLGLLFKPFALINFAALFIIYLVFSLFFLNVKNRTFIIVHFGFFLSLYLLFIISKGTIV